MAVTFIKNPIPRPARVDGAEDRTRVLVRSVGQRLFEQVLHAESAVGEPAAESGDDWYLLKNTGGLMSDLEAIRGQLRSLDRGQIQAMMTAAYIKAAALGSDAACLTRPDFPRGWNPGVLSRSCQEGVLSGSEPERTPAGEAPVGALSARFESGGGDGVDAIGYDERGGTSYGIYQLSSKAGTLDRFVDFLREREPSWASKLEAAGPADTGGRRGRMPAVWREIARQDPDRFAELQHAFVRQTHYEPAAEAIFSATGVNVNGLSRAVREVLWSTAVQHGPRRAARFFCKPLGQAMGKDGAVNEERLIRGVYELRKQTSRIFDGSIRDALLGRFSEEKKMALAMLRDDKTETLA